MAAFRGGVTNWVMQPHGETSPSFIYSSSGEHLCVCVCNTCSSPRLSSFGQRLFQTKAVYFTHYL